MATDMTEHYFRNEIKYVTEMLKYHSKETETSNGNPNECLILQKVVDDNNFELIKYMKFAYPHLDLRYDIDIVFFRAFAANNIEFINWLFGIYPELRKLVKDEIVLNDNATK